MKQTTIFGPYVGELGHEIAKFSGGVRLISKKNRDRENIIITRKDRVDLYYGAVDIIVPFEIPNDYIDYWPISAKIKAKEGKKIPKCIDECLSDCKKKYPKHEVISGISDFTYMPENDFEYTPRPKNKEIADSILSRCKENVVAITSRHRINSLGRNWRGEYWEGLFKRILSKNNYSIVVIGENHSIYKPEQNPNIHYAYQYTEKGASGIGIAIELLKKVNFFVGSQSGIVMLANLLKTPLITWGENSKRLDEDNYYNNHYSYIRCNWRKPSGCDVSLDRVYNVVEKYL